MIHRSFEARASSTPKTLLEGTTGVLLVDGYSVYEPFTVISIPK